MPTDRTLEEFGTGLGVLAGIVGFLGAWGYCWAEYGFLWGFGFGWVPAILAGLLAAVLVRWLWPLAALAGLLLGLAGLSTFVLGK